MIQDNEQFTGADLTNLRTVLSCYETDLRFKEEELTTDVSRESSKKWRQCAADLYEKAGRIRDQLENQSR